MKNRNLAFLIAPLIFILALGMMWIFFLQGDFEQDQILKNGVPGRATVLDIGTTGVIVNDQPKARLFLKVYPASGEAYKTTLEMVISPVYLPQFQPGAKLIIKIDQKNKQKVAVEAIDRKPIEE